MKVANADALEQREKRANQTLKTLNHQRTGLRAIFAASVLGMALTVGHAFTTSEESASPLKPVHVLSLAGLFIAGIAAYKSKESLEKRINTTEVRRQILQSLKNN